MFKLSNFLKHLKSPSSLLFSSLLFSSLLFSSLLFSSTLLKLLNITNTPNYDISGNSTITDSSNPDCGRIDFSSPWLSSNFNVSSNNSLVIHSTMSGYRAIFGSVNFPFASSSVSYGDSNVLLKDSFICSSNSLTIYNDLNHSSLYGSFSLLSNAISSITPSNNLINSTFSFTNNSINVSSFSNINEIYGAYIRLDTKNDSSNPITLTSSFYLDNNSINISSYCNVYRIYAAFLDLVSDRDAVYHPSTISVSSNSISISSSISNYSQIYFAYLSLYNCEVDNLLINNNTLSFTASDPNNDDFTFSVASTINSFCNDAGLLARFDLSNNFYIALLLNLGTLLPTSSF